MSRASKIIAACGNDCAKCPRHLPKTEDELHETAILWAKIGYRDHVVTNEEIACEGCKPINWCRYHVISCVTEKGINNCGECIDYPCANIKSCFEVTESFAPKCREVCSDEEYEQMREAFFEKRQNLERNND